MNAYVKFLRALYRNPKKLQADFCRYNAFHVAEAASRGHISSMIGGVAGNTWRITSAGEKFMKESGVEVYKSNVKAPI